VAVIRNALTTWFATAENALMSAWLTTLVQLWLHVLAAITSQHVLVHLELLAMAEKVADQVRWGQLLMEAHLNIIICFSSKG